MPILKREDAPRSAANAPEIGNFGRLCCGSETILKSIFIDHNFDRDGLAYSCLRSLRSPGAIGFDSLATADGKVLETTSLSLPTLESRVAAARKESYTSSRRAKGAPSAIRT